LAAAGEVAQLVEHTTENRGVAGSIPALAICSAAGRFEARSDHVEQMPRPGTGIDDRQN
jgi:hypothetical protein